LITSRAAGHCKNTSYIDSISLGWFLMAFYSFIEDFSSINLYFLSIGAFLLASVKSRAKSIGKAQDFMKKLVMLM